MTKCKCRIGLDINHTYESTENLTEDNIQPYVNDCYAHALNFKHLSYYTNKQPLELYADSAGELFQFCPDCGEKIPWNVLAPKINTSAISQTTSSTPCPTSA
jgi:hypothetical protein